ncbi:MAG: WXG100 family type VII secretion target [Coriobacteriales bacterium]|jgi:WXG100 family type VII secretion target|nr:WXG100 family type VII secretion target [Coriobacteriales bacterium]
MANVNVTYQEMEDAAKNLISKKDAIHSELNSLQSYISNLVSSGFVTDSASKKFDETYTQYTKGATETIEALQGMADYLTTAAQTLRDTDMQLGQALG